MMQRAAVQSSRLASRRAMPSAVSARRWIETGTGRESQSKGFSQKEKAQEDLFVYEREKEKAKKLREQIAKDQAELDALDKKHAEKK